MSRFREVFQDLSIARVSPIGHEQHGDLTSQEIGRRVTSHGASSNGYESRALAAIAASSPHTSCSTVASSSSCSALTTAATHTSYSTVPTIASCSSVSTSAAATTD